MSVWIVFYNPMDSYEVHGVFETQEKANDFVNELVKEDDGDKNDYRIEKWNVK